MGTVKDEQSSPKDFGFKFKASSGSQKKTEFGNKCGAVTEQSGDKRSAPVLSPVGAVTKVEAKESEAVELESALEEATSAVAAAN